MRLQLLKKPISRALVRDLAPEHQQQAHTKQITDLELILQKEEIQKKLHSIQDTQLFEERARLISKLSKIQLIRLKYDNELQQ